MDEIKSNPQDGLVWAGGGGGVARIATPQLDRLTVADARERVEKSLDYLINRLGELEGLISPILTTGDDYAEAVTAERERGTCQLADALLAYWSTITGAAAILERVYGRIGL